MGHTKRSPEFQKEIKYLIDKELMGKENTHGRVGRIIEILRNNTTDSGCMVNAAEDEPVFVLRGKDRVAGHTVGAWVQFAQDRNIHQDKTRDALQCAEEMADYCLRTNEIVD